MKINSFLMFFFLQSFSTFFVSADLPNDLGNLKNKLQSLNEQLHKQKSLPKPPPKTTPTILNWRKDITTLPSQEIFKKIINLGHKTFDQKVLNLNEWDMLLEAANQYLENPQGLKNEYEINIAKYQNNLKQLTEISTWLKSKIGKEEIKSKLDTINQIIFNAFNAIMLDTTKGNNEEEWEKRISNKKSTETFPEIDNLLNAYRISSEKDMTLEKTILPYGEKSSPEDILEKLKQVIYLETNAPWLTHSKNRLNQSIMVFKWLSERYPAAIFYAYASAKVSDSPDKPSVIMLAMAKVLQERLESLNK